MTSSEPMFGRTETNADQPTAILHDVRLSSQSGSSGRFSHTAPGPDGVESMFLKELGPVARSLLLYIVNRSWGESRTPAAWHTVLMIGIPKPHDPLKDSGL